MNNKTPVRFVANLISALLLVLLSYSPNVLFAQRDTIRNYSKQITISTDNDRYLLQGKDGYYTNGIIMKYTVASRNKKPHIQKKLNELELGQLLFTQANRKIYNPTQIDRPITGYLCAKFSQSHFLNNNSFWKWGASLGTIGKSALGENMQDFFHKVITVNSSFWGWIWDYQLKDEPGINLHGSYAIPLLPNNTSFIQITPKVDATLGTTFTNVKPGALLQLGRFNAISESSYFNARVSRNSNTERKTELYFYYHPELTWQAYNATVQGGMFRDDKGPYISAINPLVMQHQLGIVFSKPKYGVSFHVVQQTKEAKSQKANHAYGRLQLSFSFN